MQFFPGQGTFAVLVELLQMVNHHLRAAELHRAKAVRIRQISRREYEIVYSYGISPFTHAIHVAPCCHHLAGLNFFEMLDQFILLGAAKIN